MSANLSVFTSTFIKQGFQAIRNPEKLNSERKPSIVVAVVQQPESKCLKTW